MIKTLEAVNYYLKETHLTTSRRAGGIPPAMRRPSMEWGRTIKDRQTGEVEEEEDKCVNAVGEACFLDVKLFIKNPFFSPVFDGCCFWGAACEWTEFLFLCFASLQPPKAEE